MSKLDDIKAAAATRLQQDKGVVLIESDMPANLLEGSRLAMSKRPDVIIMDDYIPKSEETRALMNLKSASLLVLASSLAAPIQSLKDAVFDSPEHNLSRAERRKHRKGSNRKHTKHATIRRKLARIAKQSRTYNRMKAKGKW